MSPPTDFILRKDIEAYTGLHWRVIRRLEKARQFPRRVIRSAGKVRWKRELVDKWKEDRDMSFENKVRLMVMKPGMVMRKAYEVKQIYIEPPPGYFFPELGSDAHQAHALSWEAVWTHRDKLKLAPCTPFCKTCRSRR